MKIFPFFSVLLLTFGLSGCILSDKEDSFIWPEILESECTFENNQDLNCSSYLDGFDVPHMSASHPDKDEIWIIDLNGLIQSWDGYSLFTISNLSFLISNCHIEQGLLGFAFDENFNSSNQVLLSYIEKGPCDEENEANLILASAKIGNSGILNISSIKILREIYQPYRNHNGGYLQSIGGNQYLWGIGDGGGSNDPDSNAQDNSTPLGTIQLFSFINNEIYSVLEKTNSDPYILHNGLRNPWRFDLDINNRLWVTDVGQSCWEEINLLSINKSANLGWSEREGLHKFHSNGYTNENGTCYDDDDAPLVNDDFTDPVATYLHEGGNCSITGGFWMDWGPKSLQDGYLYGDFCSGSIWILREIEGTWTDEYIGSFKGMIVGFGRGLSDDILIFTWDGIIYSLD